MESDDADVLVLGAGVAGLACRFALTDRRDVLCVEASDDIGGLLRMYPSGDFTFDSTVHALPARDALAGTFLGSLVGEDLHRFARHNLVWQRGRAIEYPYQFHAHALPDDVRAECLAAFPQNRAGTPEADWVSFEDWLLAHFGSGFYRHFFEPYNRKLYGIGLDRLEAAPMTWTIPADSRESVLLGAAGPSPGLTSMECSYPKGREGIGSIAARLAERGRGKIRLGERVTRVDPARRTVATASGSSIRYRRLVATLPLPALLRRCTGLPDGIAQWGERLSAAPVTIVQVAIERSGSGLPAQWTYFPDPEIPFFRLTRLERISPDLAPAGASACLVEFSGDGPQSDAAVTDLCRRLGVAGAGAVECVGRLVVPHAYVRFERGHRAACAAIARHFAGLGIHVAGRYGTWGYANIGQTIDSGLRAAEDVMAEPPMAA